MCSNYIVIDHVDHCQKNKLNGFLWLINELESELNSAKKIRSVPRSLEIELVLVQVPQKRTSS